MSDWTDWAMTERMRALLRETHGNERAMEKAIDDELDNRRVLLSWAVMDLRWKIQELQAEIDELRSR